MHAERPVRRVLQWSSFDLTDVWMRSWANSCVRNGLILRMAERRDKTKNKEEGK